MKEEKRLQQLIDRYDRKARSNYDAYQNSGVQRYMREYENAEELAGFLRRALGSSDDHQMMVNYKLMLQDFCARAIRCKNERDTPDGLINELASYAGVLGVEDKYLRKE